MSFTHFTSPEQLAQSSEYLVRGVVLDTPVYAKISPGPAAAAAPDGPILVSLTHYAVIHVRVSHVVAARPDVATSIKVGETIPVGINVLDSAQRNVVVDYNRIVEEGFPTESQVPAKGKDIFAFLVGGSLGSAGKGYEAVGTTTIDTTARTARFTAVAGDLNADTANVASLTGGSLVKLYETPGPWKAGKP